MMRNHQQRGRKLVSERNFLVTVTRLRDGITLIVDSGERLQRAVERNPGAKTSALESVRGLERRAGRQPVREAEASRPEVPGATVETPDAKTAQPRQDRELQKSRSRPLDYGL